jgi:hypothetical protein
MSVSLHLVFVVRKGGKSNTTRIRPWGKKR